MTDICVLTSQYYKELAKALEAAAQEVFHLHNLSYDTYPVPGALEIPLALSMILKHRPPQTYKGYLCIGCVIKGETDHYDIVCQESIGGIMSLGIKHALSLCNCFLTVHNKEQALERIQKGRSSALALVNMLSLENTIKTL